ncbi:DUF3800 domain-containing protein [Sedimentitalea nanhaiensis]|uniref:DUF3800 domain-containing protein n=1 Tax=Sedimentitalea nanhaiensis TaxID=999627 RepID=A0A1I7E8R2_9RHOB|nr:DUF3800 domain-containing protein [Sedimentitalea nanhaiensis]SFU20327.1 Protein of unknown function [Sedimentitalea nanhaiensis]
MSWALFIDESGQDQRQSPYEVLAGIAIEDRKLWRLIRDLSDAQEEIFGLRLFEAYGSEAKAQKLLKKKVFTHAAQMPPFPADQRRTLAREILQDGTAVSRERLTALAQAKLAYVCRALDISRKAKAQAFASIVPQTAPRPAGGMLRKDYAYLFERFFYFLNSQPEDPMGYVVFDELDKSASHILLTQVSEYFLKTNKGRTRSRLIIPEPFFVHSDMTTMVQVADLMAYFISWGVRLNGMHAQRRPELDDLSRKVMRLRFTQHTPGGYTNYGFKIINDLRAAVDQ